MTAIIARPARKSSPIARRVFGAGILPASEATRAAIFDAETAAVAADLDARIAEGAARLEANRRRLEASEAMVAALDAPPARPARFVPSAEDQAYEAGYSLGESGYEPDQVAAPRRFTAGEVEAFAAGVARGAEARWADYARHLEELADRERTMEALFADPYREFNEAELAAAGSCVGH